MPKCKECKKVFNPQRPLQVVCSLECAKLQLNKKKDKEWKQRKKSMKTALKTVTDYRSDLQDLINEIARLIDYGQRCISCDGIPKKANGCHFKSVGAHSKIRYNLLNIYLGCNRCNSEMGGNVHGYDDGIIKHFGREFWEYIKFQIILDFDALDLTIDDLKEKISICRQIVKEMKSDLNVLNDSERIKKRIELNNKIGIYENKYKLLIKNET